MQVRRVASSACLLGVSLYILLPTADEIVIHPVFGLFLSCVLNVPLTYGILLSMAIYRLVGIGCMAGALSIGGKQVYNKLKQRFKKAKIG